MLLGLLFIIGLGLHCADQGLWRVCVLGDVELLGELSRYYRIDRRLGPALLGTVIGYHITSLAYPIFFLALASGALIYLLGELAHFNPTKAFKSEDGRDLGFLLTYFAGEIAHCEITL